MRTANMTTTREIVVEALKVPMIMGKGKAYGIVIGDRRLHGLIVWAKKHDEPLYKVLTAEKPTLFGRQILVTTLHTDTLFAVTEDEYNKLVAELCI